MELLQFSTIEDGEVVEWWPEPIEVSVQEILVLAAPLLGRDVPPEVRETVKSVLKRVRLALERGSTAPGADV